MEVNWFLVALYFLFYFIFIFLEKLKNQRMQKREIGYYFKTMVLKLCGVHLEPFARICYMFINTFGCVLFF